MAARAMQLALLPASIQKSACQHSSFFPAPQPSGEPLHRSEKWGFLFDETVAVNYINLQICTIDLEQSYRRLFHSDLNPQDAMLVNSAQQSIGKHYRSDRSRCA